MEDDGVLTARVRSDGERLLGHPDSTISPPGPKLRLQRPLWAVAISSGAPPKGGAADGSSAQAAVGSGITMETLPV